MMTTVEIIKDAALWWMVFSGIALIICLSFLFQDQLEKIDPEDKFLKKILGKRLYNFLKEVL